MYENITKQNFMTMRTSIDCDKWGWKHIILYYLFKYVCTYTLVL